MCYLFLCKESKIIENKQWNFVQLNRKIVQTHGILCLVYGILYMRRV